MGGPDRNAPELNMYTVKHDRNLADTQTKRANSFQYKSHASYWFITQESKNYK